MNSKPLLTEDWATVVLAFGIIGLSLFGVVPSFPTISWRSFSDLSDQMAQAAIWLQLLYLFIFALVIIAASAFLKREKLHVSQAVGLGFIFLITFLSQIVTGNTAVKNLGLEIVIFSLLIGLAISNLGRVPDWVKPLIQTELYIKIGLVLLGCGIIFQDVLKAGGLGMIQSMAVVLVVWQFCFWLGKRFKLDDELRAMLSSAVAICGVSAAIATAGAIKGDSKKLSYVISLVLVTAIPMMLAMPYIAREMGLTDSVAGAWLGGTIDTTGAVVAAGTLLGEEGLKYATVVKFSQNVLLGLAAFVISIYWSYTKSENNEKPSLATIWERFPKFVIGFLLASLLFSFVLPAETVSEIKNPIKGIQTFWFALAFTCIGLETKFADIFKMESGRPAWVFLIAQLFNILFTLLVAWLVF